MPTQHRQPAGVLLRENHVSHEYPCDIDDPGNGQANGRATLTRSMDSALQANRDKQEQEYRGRQSQRYCQASKGNRDGREISPDAGIEPVRLNETNQPLESAWKRNRTRQPQRQVH